MNAKGEPAVLAMPQPVSIPSYLRETYWWAYVHPRAVAVFERQWLVNLILLGNFSRLRDAAVASLGNPVKGKILQVACVYGDFTQRIAARLEPGASLDVVDVLPIQLDNLRKKIAAHGAVKTWLGDSAALGFADASYDQTVLFFLLHEQPDDVRRRTLSEALRVTRPGGRIVIFDYHRPYSTNPFRYLLWPVLHRLEPFALDLWRHEIEVWLPAALRSSQVHRKLHFGGLYQQVVIDVPEKAQDAAKEIR